MSLDATNPAAGRGSRLFRSPALLAVAFALFLWGLVLFLNWLGPSEVPVTEEQFRRLEARGAITAIAVGDDGLHCRLGQRVRVANVGGDMATEQVFLPLRSGVSEARLQAWRAAGVSVARARPEDGQGRHRAGLALVGGLLAVGVWHLWSQIRLDRRGR
ncbi:MAG: hypothetical protein AB1505_28545, partial [Candidatus Latescibacterota bacterium]